MWFGGLADRYDCRKIIVASQVSFIAASLAWALLFLTGTLQTWHAVVLLIVHGLAGALWSPAGQLIVQDIVGHDQLQSGVRLAATGRSVGILFGPAVVGALLLGLGPAYGLMANALVYLPMTIWMLRMPYTGHVRTRANDESARLSLADAVRTLREMSANRGIHLRPRTPELKDGGSISIPGWHAHEDEASFRHVAAIVVDRVRTFRRRALRAPRVGANHEAIGTGAGQSRGDELHCIRPPKALAKEFVGHKLHGLGNLAADAGHEDDGVVRDENEGAHAGRLRGPRPRLDHPVRLAKRIQLSLDSLGRSGR